MNSRLLRGLRVLLSGALIWTAPGLDFYVLLAQTLRPSEKLWVLEQAGLIYLDRRDPVLPLIYDAQRGELTSYGELLYQLTRLERQGGGEDSTSRLEELRTGLESARRSPIPPEELEALRQIPELPLEDAHSLGARLQMHLEGMLSQLAPEGSTITVDPKNPDAWLTQEDSVGNRVVYNSEGRPVSTFSAKLYEAQQQMAKNPVPGCPRVRPTGKLDKATEEYFYCERSQILSQLAGFLEHLKAQQLANMLRVAERYNPLYLQSQASEIAKELERGRVRRGSLFTNLLMAGRHGTGNTLGILSPSLQVAANYISKARRAILDRKPLSEVNRWFAMAYAEVMRYAMIMQHSILEEKEFSKIIPQAAKAEERRLKNRLMGTFALYGEIQAVLNHPPNVEQAVSRAFEMIQVLEKQRFQIDMQAFLFRAAVILQDNRDRIFEGFRGDRFWRPTWIRKGLQEGIAGIQMLSRAAEEGDYHWLKNNLAQVDAFTAQVFSGQYRPALNSLVSILPQAQHNAPTPFRNPADREQDPAALREQQLFTRAQSVFTAVMGKVQSARYVHELGVAFEDGLAIEGLATFLINPLLGLGQLVVRGAVGALRAKRLVNTLGRIAMVGRLMARTATLLEKVGRAFQYMRTPAQLSQWVQAQKQMIKADEIRKTWLLQKALAYGEHASEMLRGWANAHHVPIGIFRIPQWAARPVRFAAGGGAAGGVLNTGRHLYNNTLGGGSEYGSVKEAAWEGAKVGSLYGGAMGLSGIFRFRQGFNSTRLGNFFTSELRIASPFGTLIVPARLAGPIKFAAAMSLTGGTVSTGLHYLQLARGVPPTHENAWEAAKWGALTGGAVGGLLGTAALRASWGRRLTSNSDMLLGGKIRLFPKTWSQPFVRAFNLSMIGAGWGGGEHLIDSLRGAPTDFNNGWEALGQGALGGAIFGARYGKLFELMPPSTFFSGRYAPKPTDYWARFQLPKLIAAPVKWSAALGTGGALLNVGDHYLQNHYGANPDHPNAWQAATSGFWKGAKWGAAIGLTAPLTSPLTSAMRNRIPLAGRLIPSYSPMKIGLLKPIPALRWALGWVSEYAKNIGEYPGFVRANWRTLTGKDIWNPKQSWLGRAIERAPLSSTVSYFAQMTDMVFQFAWAVGILRNGAEALTYLATAPLGMHPHERYMAVRKVGEEVEMWGFLAVPQTPAWAQKQYSQSRALYDAFNYHKRTGRLSRIVYGEPNEILSYRRVRNPIEILNLGDIFRFIKTKILRIPEAQPEVRVADLKEQAVEEYVKLLYRKGRLDRAGLYEASRVDFSEVTNDVYVETALHRRIGNARRSRTKITQDMGAVAARMWEAETAKSPELVRNLLEKKEGEPFELAGYGKGRMDALLRQTLLRLAADPKNRRLRRNLPKDLIRQADAAAKTSREQIEALARYVEGKLFVELYELSKEPSAELRVRRPARDGTTPPAGEISKEKFAERIEAYLRKHKELRIDSPEGLYTYSRRVEEVLPKQKQLLTDFLYALWTRQIVPGIQSGSIRVASRNGAEFIDLTLMDKVQGILQLETGGGKTFVILELLLPILQVYARHKELKLKIVTTNKLLQQQFANEAKALHRRNIEEEVPIVTREDVKGDLAETSMYNRRAEAEKEFQIHDEVDKKDPQLTISEGASKISGQNPQHQVMQEAARWVEVLGREASLRYESEMKRIELEGLGTRERPPEPIESLTRMLQEWARTGPMMDPYTGRSHKVEPEKAMEFFAENILPFFTQRLQNPKFLKGLTAADAAEALRAVANQTPRYQVEDPASAQGSELSKGTKIVLEVGLLPSEMQALTDAFSKEMNRMVAERVRQAQNSPAQNISPLQRMNPFNPPAASGPQKPNPKLQEDAAGILTIRDIHDALLEAQTNTGIHLRNSKRFFERLHREFMLRLQRNSREFQAAKDRLGEPIQMFSEMSQLYYAYLSGTEQTRLESQSGDAMAKFNNENSPGLITPELRLRQLLAEREIGKPADYSLPLEERVLIDDIDPLAASGSFLGLSGTASKQFLESLRKIGSKNLVVVDQFRTEMINQRGIQNQPDVWFTLRWNHEVLPQVARNIVENMGQGNSHFVMLKGTRQLRLFRKLLMEKGIRIPESSWRNVEQSLETRRREGISAVSEGSLPVIRIRMGPKGMSKIFSDMVYLKQFKPQASHRQANMDSFQRGEALLLVIDGSIGGRGFSPKVDSGVYAGKATMHHIHPELIEYIENVQNWGRIAGQYRLPDATEKLHYFYTSLQTARRNPVFLMKAKEAGKQLVDAEIIEQHWMASSEQAENGRVSLPPKK